MQKNRATFWRARFTVKPDQLCLDSVRVVHFDFIFMSTVTHETPISFRLDSCAKYLLAAIFLSCPCVLPQFPTLYDLRTDMIGVETKQELAITREQNAICKLASNLDVESQN